MKYFLKKNALSLLSLAVSTTTLVLFWCRFEPFTWSSFGVMATVMGVIVTFLVGFQIWAVIDTKEFKRELKGKQEELDKSLKLAEYNRLFNLFTINYELSMVYYEMNKNVFPYLKFALQTLEYGVVCNQISICNTVIKAMGEVLSGSEISFTKFNQNFLGNTKFIMVY